MAKRRGPIPIGAPPPGRPPPLTTRRGRLVVYVVCRGGRARNSPAVSHYFSVAPGTSRRALLNFAREWARGKLTESSKPGGPKGVGSGVICSVQPSLGDLPEGSAAMDVE